MYFAKTQYGMLYRIFGEVLTFWFLQSLKNPFCVPTDELLRAKDDLLSEGGQRLNSIFADCFGDWFIGIPLWEMMLWLSKLHYIGTQKGTNLGQNGQNVLGGRALPRPAGGA